MSSRATERVNPFIELIRQPKKLAGVGGTVLLMGVGLLGVGTSDTKTIDQEIGQKVDSAMGLLSDDQVNGARRQLSVDIQINNLVDAEWNSDLNTANAGDLRQRINSLKQVIEELSGEKGNQALAVFDLESQRSSYAAKLREPYSLRDFRDKAMQGIGGVMLFLGWFGGLVGVVGIAEKRGIEASKRRY